MLVQKGGLKRRPDTGARCQMNNRIGFLLAADGKHLLLVADIRLVEGRGSDAPDGVQIGALDRRRVEIVQVIYDREAVSIAQEAFAQVRADKASSSGNENSHLWHLSLDRCC